MANAIVINPNDNAAIALEPIPAGERAICGDTAIPSAENIPQGHKIALKVIRAGEKIIKYGFPIGIAVNDISPGEHIHIHNIRTALGDNPGAWEYSPAFSPLPAEEPETFMGYMREDGRAAIRNELWIIPGAGCVNGVCSRLAELSSGLSREFGLDGVYAFPHPHGCSQTGDDLDMTRLFLASLANNPNAGGVLIVSLGCENNEPGVLREEIIRQAGGAWNPDKFRFLVCQDEKDELEAGAAMLRELAAYAAKTRRVSVPASKLVVGMKCGGSDGLSGITANPLLGMVCDRLIARGASVILTEVPEMFGAERVLLNRCESREVFDAAASMLGGFRDYFSAQGRPVYENPAPGNYQGGISTLEEKSLGCVQKGGSAPVTDVIGYGRRVRKNGLTLLSGPGSDLVSAANLAAAGAHIVLFTTGRGTPYGTAVPTVKISSNTPLYDKKRDWIDFDAGTIARGESSGDAVERFYSLILKTACGEVLTKAEINGYREIQIFKNGVTL